MKYKRLNCDTAHKRHILKVSGFEACRRYLYQRDCPYGGFGLKKSEWVMRYNQSAAQTADLLRRVIPYMTKHGRNYSPVHYTLWYEYLAETHPALKRHLDEMLRNQPVLSAADSEQLFTRFIVARDAEFNEKLQQSLEDLMKHLSSVAQSAGDDAAHFEKHLKQASTLLSGPLDAEGLSQVVSCLAVQTESLISATGKLQQQIETGTREIQKLKDQLGQVNSDAHTDPLTKLMNRRGFDRAVGALTNGSGAVRGAALIMADIDNFKRINDTYGHMLGDEVIRCVAQLIRKTVKGGDIVARFGGEEFIVLLPDTGLDPGRAVAESIRIAVSRARLERTERQEVLEGITVSIGLAAAGGDEALAMLIAAADRALYRAKQQGRNCVACAEDSAPQATEAIQIARAGAG